MQILDCTSFVSHSPSAAFGSQGKRFFTSFKMTKGLGFGRSLRGTPGDSRMFAGLRRPRLRPARLERAEERRNDIRSKNHCSAPSAAFLRAIAPCACCGLPPRVDGRLGVQRYGWLRLLCVAFACWFPQRQLFGFQRGQRGPAALCGPGFGSFRALRPSICTEVVSARLA